MAKTLLITGSTDGIGLLTARLLAEAGHTVLLHGRNADKLEHARAEIAKMAKGAPPEAYLADLSRLDDVVSLADAVKQQHRRLHVLINNAGIYVAAGTASELGVDLRFVVNTIAPYLLTRELLPILEPSGRIINLSSAAQAAVDLQVLQGGGRKLSDAAAYAQSKLAITMWSVALAAELGTAGPAVIAVNPASLLGSKMVKEAYGVAGADLGIGADILIRAALSSEFEKASGLYYDNDVKSFAAPHPDARDATKNKAIVSIIDTLIDRSVSTRGE